MNLQEERRDYEGSSFDTSNPPSDPIKLFDEWLQAALDSGEEDATCFALTTNSLDFPDSRILLLKERSAKGFYFFTNYDSTKGQQLASDPRASMLFYWKNTSRQVRIYGNVVKCTTEESDDYFYSRPELSQKSAVISPQSKVISGRAELTASLESLSETIKRPNNWGGYILQPVKIEFWQGQMSRLHDRVLYKNIDSKWITKILAP